MKVSVQTTKDTFDFDVQPGMTVKKVMEMVVAKEPVPSWANQALLYRNEPKDAFHAKKTLDSCGIIDGSVVKFCYAKHLTRTEKQDMMSKGQIPMEDAPQPVNHMSIDAAPASWYALTGQAVPA